MRYIVFIIITILARCSLFSGDYTSDTDITPEEFYANNSCTEDCLYIGEERCELLGDRENPFESPRVGCVKVIAVSSGYVLYTISVYERSEFLTYSHH